MVGVSQASQETRRYEDPARYPNLIICDIPGGSIADEDAEKYYE